MATWVWPEDDRCSDSSDEGVNPWGFPEGEYPYIRNITDTGKINIYAVGEFVTVDDGLRLAKIKKLMNNSAGEKVFLAQWFVRPKDVGKSPPDYHVNEIFLSAEEESEVGVSTISGHFHLKVVNSRFPITQENILTHFVIQYKWDNTLQDVIQLTEAEVEELFDVHRKGLKIGMGYQVEIPPWTGSRN